MDQEIHFIPSDVWQWFHAQGMCVLTMFPTILNQLDS